MNLPQRKMKQKKKKKTAAFIQGSIRKCKFREVFKQECNNINFFKLLFAVTD